MPSETETRSATAAATAPVKALQKRPSYCSLPMTKPREFSPDVNPNRAALIEIIAKKWVNGTTLQYHFLNSPAAWAGSAAQQNVVRRGFQVWTDLGIGLKFEETASSADSEVRVGFLRGDGAWSYIGRDILNIGRDDRTMNFGWDLTDDLDTAVHEIGHTLGFPHEHQNPNAGIVWNEQAVYDALAGPPNYWPREKTYYNIIRKISPDTVQGSNWDPDSIMHYPFEPGLILEPEAYRNGLTPAGGLSARDKQWVRTFYPPLQPQNYTVLQPFQSVPLTLAPGQQADFVFQPATSRYYEMRTFGTSDTVMVLFEEESSGRQRYLSADDDSGEDRNAYIRKRLFAGRKYIIRLRLYYADRSGDTAVMVW